MNLESSDVNEKTVSNKPHTFIESNVVAWFSAMEAQFNIAKIKTPTLQFHRVLATLAPEIV